MRKTTSLMIGVTATVLAFGFTTPVLAKDVADAVYVNGKVFTADTATSVVEGFAVKGDRFIAAGTTEQMRDLVGPKTLVVDLEAGLLALGRAIHMPNRKRAAAKA